MLIAYPVRDLNLLSLGSAVPKQWNECSEWGYYVALVPNGHYEQGGGYASKLTTEANLIIISAMLAQKPSMNDIGWRTGV